MGLLTEHINNQTTWFFKHDFCESLIWNTLSYIWRANDVMAILTCPRFAICQYLVIVIKCCPRFAPLEKAWREELKMRLALM